ncbi:MAG: four-carbon acid sugar kinase family protein [Actinomycetota bacterium]|nr:four-carbon acid sugar kinase family protein [Actinomycetota bacterium]
MARVLVVADDLTGANAAAAGFSRAGMRAVTVGLGRRWDAVAEFHSRFDVVVVTTESRHASAAEVREAVTRSARAGWPVDLVCCRIDTTLRGNVGVSTEALLHVAAGLSGRRTVGLCLPAHPTAGRHTVDGFQLLYGKRLEETELVRDPRSPVRTSSVAEVLRAGTSLVTANVSLSAVTGDAAALEEALADAVRGGADVLIGDALTEDHLVRLAEAAAVVGRTADVDWVGVDPGPGSVALAAALGIRGHGEGGPLLAVSGSATELTRVQLQALRNACTVHVVRPTSLTGSPVPDVDATVAELRKVVEAARPGEVVLLATALTAEDVVPLQGDAGTALPQALGRVTRRVLQECVVDGLYTTGGDVTAAVLDELGARGLDVEDEVVPLAVAGEIVDGPWSGMPIVTKGGLVGDARTAVACIEHLARAATAHARRVQTAVPRSPA